MCQPCLEGITGDTCRDATWDAKLVSWTLDLWPPTTWVKYSSWFPGWQTPNFSPPAQRHAWTLRPALRSYQSWHLWSPSIKENTSQAHLRPRESEWKSCRRWEFTTEFFCSQKRSETLSSGFSTIHGRRLRGLLWGLDWCEGSDPAKWTGQWKAVSIGDGVMDTHSGCHQTARTSWDPQNRLSGKQNLYCKEDMGYCRIAGVTWLGATLSQLEPSHPSTRRKPSGGGGGLDAALSCLHRHGNAGSFECYDCGFLQQTLWSTRSWCGGWTRSSVKIYWSGRFCLSGWCRQMQNIFLP